VIAHNDNPLGKAMDGDVVSSYEVAMPKLHRIRLYMTGHIQHFSSSVSEDVHRFLGLSSL